MASAAAAAAHSSSIQRVKVYRLRDGGKWDEQGTGHVAIDYIEGSKDLGLTVLDEDDNETLLVHNITSDDIYRKQEETIISWMDPEAATESALSFQEAAGCSYIWDNICDIQRNLAALEVGPIGKTTFPDSPINIVDTNPVDLLAEFVPTGSTSKQQQEGMSGVGSSTPDANAWSFSAGMSWRTPPTEPLSMAPSMAQYLSHEMLPIGNYKYSCAAELWRALADLAEPLLSIPPAAAEELRRIHRGVTESSARAKERAKALHGYIQKLEKYQSDLVWQRQRTRLGFHHRMTFQELRRITDGFSEKRLLGKGGFGMVYRGVLDDGEVIAVKKLNPQQGLTGDSFRNEIQNLMRVQHQNIIRLVGYCEETRDRVVEYEGKLVAAVEIDRAICLEYMQGGTLEKHLSDESCGLDWEARYRIIKGTCQGLQHLHTGSDNPIYHLDLNPANILLDKDQIPKIGDFGLSRLLASPATFVTKTNSGTLGYMPPEYMHGQQISSKFDVFSLGIVIIKVIAGPDGYFKYKCIYTSPKKFMDHVTQNWSKRVQARKMSAVSLQKVKKCIKMALRCVEDDRAKRPTITEVVKELNMIS